ncbi:MAG: ABC-type transport auxiliary lipoprotein family protein [Spirochaeta sp.]
MKPCFFRIIYTSTIIPILLMTAGCATPEPPPTYYYTLDYLDYTEDEDLIRREPLPYRIWVQSAEIPRTYSGRQMVVRHFGPQISYSDNQLWAGRLGDYLPRLLTSRLQAYNTFQDTSMDFLDTRPDYEITIRVNRIELVQSEELSEASLDMTLTLHTSDGETALSHRTNIMEPIYTSSMELYVQTMNELILEEIDAFIEKTYKHFDNPPEGEDPAEQTSEVQDDQEADAPEGHGVLLMPSISGIEDAGGYQAVSEDGQEYEGMFGRDLALPAGQYQLFYGTGPRELQMQMRGVRINRGYRTLVEPDWGELSVEIVDERRNHRDIIYEVFDEEGTSYISRFPARRDLGDSPSILHLPPGLYKITIQNMPFNTTRNFTTVLVEEGEWRRLTIVVDVLDESLIGAGIVDDDTLPLETGNRQINSAIHATANLAGDHRSWGEEGTYSINFTSQLDNELRFRFDRLSLNAAHFSELGLEYEGETGLTISQDDHDLSTSAIFDVYLGIGLYAHFGLNSHLFPRYEQEPRDGSEGPKQVAPPLFPLQLEEGVGLNIKILNDPRASLTVRTGFGLRQEYNRDVLEFAGDQDQYQPVNDSSSIGLEISSEGSFRPLRRIQLQTSADLLFPLVEGDNIILEWETGLNWTLLRSVSLNYRFSVVNSPQNDVFDLEYTHRMVLRLTYILN